MASETQLSLVEKNLVKLDFGCGKNKREGFLGVDILDFEGVDVKLDIGNDPWPWEDNTVEEAHASHFVEHLTGMQRVHFVNELHRVLVPGAGCLIITPHWASQRAYGDVTHQWPPVSEFWFYYLSEEWRKVNAPHNSFYKCDFEVTWGHNLRPDIAARNVEYQSYALNNFKEVATDLLATLKKKVKQ
jgi:hypothetical protein